MFPGNLTNNGLPKCCVLQSAKTYLKESYTDDILPVHGTVIHEVAHYRTSMLMSMRFFLVATKYEVIISHAARTQEGCTLSTMSLQGSPIWILRYHQKHTSQSENTSTTTPPVYHFQDHNKTVHPVQDHIATICPLQNHKTLYNFEGLKNMFLDSCDK